MDHITHHIRQSVQNIDWRRLALAALRVTLNDTGTVLIKGGRGYQRNCDERILAH